MKNRRQVIEILILFSSCFDEKYNVQCSKWREIKKNIIWILNFTHILTYTTMILNTTVYKAVACSGLWQIIAALYMDFFTVMHSSLAEKLQKSTSIVK